MKITKFFLSMAAAVGMIAGCYKPEMVQIPAIDDVVAPVLEEYEGAINITPTNMALDTAKFQWAPADYGVSTQVSYAFEAAKESTPDAKVVIASGLADTAVEGSLNTTAVTYEALNQILFNDLELADGIAENVLFFISAKVGQTQKIYSNAITVSCKVTAAEKVYPKLSVAGSYNGWTHDTQYLFDFAGEDKVYQAVIDFGADHAANEFKITGGAWGKDEHSMDGAHDAESKTIKLVAGGGDNINVYQAKRYYHLTFDRALTLTADFSFDQIGVIGDFNSWGADVVMNFNAAKQKFYADVEFPADGGFKFRLDGGWDVSYGSTGSGVLDSGDNIPVKAGNYRVYLNMNNAAQMTYTLDASMFGKDEPVGGTTPEPEPEPEPEVKGWNLIGIGGNWDTDVLMSDVQGFRAATNVTINAGEGFKLRLDGAWDDNRGLASDAEEENVVIEIGAALDVVNNGKNMTVAETGAYDIYYDNENEKLYVLTTGSPIPGTDLVASEWGVVGQVNGWAAPDVTMYKTDTEGLFVAYNVAMPDGGFKIRANGEWNDAANYGLKDGKGNVEVDHAYEVITSGGSGDMILVAGNYDIWFDLTNSKVYIMTPGKSITEAEGGEAVTPEPEPEPETQDWYLVGDFNGWTAADANYKLTLEGNWYVFKNFTADGKGVKFVADANWTVNRGGTFVAAGEAIEVVHDGANLEVAAGTYDVYLSKDASVAYFMTPGEAPAAELDGTWYLVGDFNGWTAADENYKMTAENGWYVFKNFTADGKGVKFVADANWTVNRGGTFVAAGEAIEVVHDGANLEVTAGSYDVYLNADASKAYFMEVGKTPAN